MPIPEAQANPARDLDTYDTPNEAAQRYLTAMRRLIEARERFVVGGVGVAAVAAAYAEAEDADAALCEWERECDQKKGGWVGK